MGYRARLIKLFTFLGGLYFFLEFILPEKILDFKFSAYSDQITTGYQAVAAMAVGLGLINLVMVHGSKIAFSKKGAFNSFGLLLGLVLMTAITIWDWRESESVSTRVLEISKLSDFAEKIKKDADASPTDPILPKLETRLDALRTSLNIQLRLVQAELTKEVILPEQKALVPDLTDSIQAIERQKRLAFVKDSQQGLEFLPPLAQAISALSASWREWLDAEYQNGLVKHCYKLLYDGFFVALGSAMFSLLGFYIASAAYRAFRIRSAESALMMIAALIVMLGQIPFGIWIWDQFPAIRLWLLTVPNSAAFRAIELGAAVAGLIMAFRMWLSIESDSFSKAKNS